MNDGFSLSELLIVLTVLAVRLHAGSSVADGLVDGWAVMASREEAVGLIGLARTRAVGTAGASVTFDESRGTVELVSAWPDTLLRPAADHGVTMQVVGSTTRYELRFDALGLARVGSRRLRFSRGGRTADLVVSSYGRVRRP